MFIIMMLMYSSWSIDYHNAHYHDFSSNIPQKDAHVMCKVTLNLTAPLR